MDIAWVEAARLARANRSLAEEFKDRHAALVERAERETQAQMQRRQEVYEHVLVPFSDAFARLDSLDVVKLASLDLPTDPTPQIGLFQLRLSALHIVGEIAGGLSEGAGAGPLVSLGRVAVAPTPAAISGTSVAVATDATLAARRGGFLAAGGVAAGALVLINVMAVPAVVATVGLVAWQGRRHRRLQREGAVAIAAAEVALRRAEENTTAVIQRGRQVRVLLSDLQDEASAHLSQLRALVDAADDYTGYSPAQRSEVAITVSLVVTAISMMATPLADEKGVLTGLSGQVIDDVRQRLRNLGSVRTIGPTAPPDAD